MFVESPVVLFLVTYGPVGELRLALVFFVLVQFYRRGFIHRFIHRAPDLLSSMSSTWPGWPPAININMKRTEGKRMMSALVKKDLQERIDVRIVSPLCIASPLCT